MTIYLLHVKDRIGPLKCYFTHRADAQKTFDVTYSKVEEKPKYEIQSIEILDSWTHL